MPGQQGADSATDRIRVEATAGAGTSYNVVIRPGSLDRLPELMGPLGTAHRTAIISDEAVAALYGSPLLRAFSDAGVSADLLSVPPGEVSKTRETWADLTDQLTDLGFGRDSRVIALGGGVVGDLAGFVAATYMRGVRFVNVPTSLLAMIDASVGGKTGVDTAAGKNLVGAFHQPELVVIDPSVLSTLADHHFHNGLAEAIKHGVVVDAGYTDWMRGNAAAIQDRDASVVTTLIERSVRIKAGVVAADTMEAGVRAILNFGHTIGHAIERVSGWRVAHGAAVAAGMAIEAQLGERLGVTAAGTAASLAALLALFGLPTGTAGMDVEPEALISATHSDKKARSAAVRYVLPAALGRIARPSDGAWTWPVQDSDVAATLTATAGPTKAISQVETDV